MSDQEAWAPELIARERPSACACLKSIIEMSVLTLETPKIRQQTALLCLYAWAISMLPDATNREKYIAELWKTTMAGKDLNTIPDMRSWFENEVQEVIALRMNYFPSLKTFVDDVKLVPTDEDYDRLFLSLNGVVETFELRHVESRDLALSLGQRITKISNAVEQLECWFLDDLGRYNSQFVVEGAQLQCGIWRVELATYKGLANSLYRIQKAPAPKRATGAWITLADEADGKIVEFLATLQDD
jgi:hypothetical protein